MFSLNCEWFCIKEREAASEFTRSLSLLLPKIKTLTSFGQSTLADPCNAHTLQTQSEKIESIPKNVGCRTDRPSNLGERKEILQRGYKGCWRESGQTNALLAAQRIKRYHIAVTQCKQTSHLSLKSSCKNVFNYLCLQMFALNLKF